MKLLVILAAALVLASGAGAAPFGADASPPEQKCPKGKVAWRFGTKKQCVGRTSFAPAPCRGAPGADDLSTKVFQQDLHDEWTAPVGSSVSGLLTGLSALAPPATVDAFRIVAGASSARRFAAARDGLPPGWSVNPDGSISGIEQLGDGVQMVANGRGTSHTSPEDDAKALGKSYPEAGDELGDRYVEQHTDITYSKAGTSLAVTIADGGAPARVEACPTAEGEVAAKASDSLSVSAKATLATGESSTRGFNDKWEARFDGQVGEDAHLEYFDVTYDDTNVVYIGGAASAEVRTHISARVNVRAARAGAVGSYTNLQGTTDVTIDADTPPLTGAALQSLKERDAQDRAHAFRLIVERALRLFDRAEEVWYDADASTCVDVKYSPEPSKIKPSKRVAVHWTSRSKRDKRQAAGTWDASEPEQGTIAPKHARSEPNVAAEIAFTASSHLDSDSSAGYHVLFTSRAGRGKRAWLAEAEEFPYRYTVLAVNVATQASGSQTVPGGLCADSSGTRDFTAKLSTSAAQKSELDKSAGGQLSGSIVAPIDGTYTNDVLHGCNFAPDGTVVPCTYTAPERHSAAGDAITFSIDPQRLGASLKGHWLTASPEIGFVDGTPSCNFTPYVADALSSDEIAATYPLSTFRDAGAHTIEFSGHKHFDTLEGGFIEQILDFTWSVSVTFKRV